KGEDKDGDPFDKTRAAESVSRPGSDLLARAEQEFGSHRYREARVLYEQAHRANPNVSEASRERWAYCKLHSVVEQINATSSGTLPWPDLEREVQAALELAPRLDCAKQLLLDMEKRRRGLAGAETPGAEPPVAIRHLGPNRDGWQICETTNFRLLHT